MPVLTEYSDECLTIRLVGEHSHDEMQQAFADAFPSATTRTAGLLVDVTQSTSLRSRPSDQVRKMAAWTAAHGERFHHRLAVLATVGSVEYGMSRLAAVTAEATGVTVEVFTSETEARAWLGR